MTRSETIAILEQHNAWRMDNEGKVEPVNPTKLGKAIDRAVELLKKGYTK